MSDWSSRLSVVLIVAVLGICFWRARTQSFTVDEAWAYNLFVEPKIATMAKVYDACNHVLHTLLVKASKARFGGGELALRLPSLLAALLYSIAAYRLTRLLLNGWAQVLCLALLLLNPMVLDLLIAARGYGLANALFLWALYCAIAYHTRGFDTKWLRFAGVLAGLSISANLTMAVPAAALGLALLLLASRDGLRACWAMVDGYGGPAVITAFLILIIPLLPATAEHFYFGATSAASAVDSLVATFLKNDARWPSQHRDAFLRIGRLAVVPLILLALTAGAVVGLGKWLRSAHREWRLAPFLLIAVTVVGSVLALVTANTLLGVKYPLGRTGLYFIPLTVLACFAGAHALGNRALRTALNVGGAAVLVLCVIQTDNRYFIDWKYDSGTARLLRRLEADFAQRLKPGQPPVSLGTNQFLTQTAIWYRNRRGWNWMEKPEREDPGLKLHDYYLLVFEDTALVSKLGLEVIAEDKLSGEVLARRQ